MAYINRVPQGLLGLLDLKAQGENPAQLNPFVQATLELRDLYAYNVRATNSQASTLTGLGVTSGAFANLIVPQGELWLLSGLTATLSSPPLGAAATFSCAVGFVPADVSRFIALGPDSKTIATGGDVVAQQQEGVYLLGPGDGPQVNVTTLTGGNLGVRLSFQRARFQI